MTATPPQVGRDEQYFWEGAAERQLLLQRCGSCGTLRHPPLPCCPHCGATQWEAIPASGRGTVHSWIVCDAGAAGTRIAAAVRLEEGPCFVTNLTEVEPADVRNDMPVEVTFVPAGELTMPLFRPAEGPSR